MVELLHPVMCAPTVTLSEYISHLSIRQQKRKQKQQQSRNFDCLADNMLTKDKIHYKKPSTHLSLASVHMVYKLHNNIYMHITCYKIINSY